METVEIAMEFLCFRGTLWKLWQAMGLHRIFFCRFFLPKPHGYCTNMDECVEYVTPAEAEEGGVFAYQSENASFQIVPPAANVGLSHGMLHQIAVRDPIDQYDLSDHLTWQLNMAIDHNEAKYIHFPTLRWPI